MKNTDGGLGGGPENQTMTHFNIQRVGRDEAPEVCMEACKTGSAGGTTRDTCHLPIFK